MYFTDRSVFLHGDCDGVCQCEHKTDCPTKLRAERAGNHVVHPATLHGAVLLLVLAFYLQRVTVH